ncbi:PrsW family intramembrane metalloprotease [Anaerocellum danielii]|uniref:Protease PrsW n=1 Tax=Anaerocellum danielii TaxID=1387557 RepID=A0ABZ0U230_9FIRM|nr:PrsW family glutamic-type intramembrane protease [Caldicellulosiruptor danielii]WPX09773.1 PrsW family glutamic-type intramembrane protease [Caldicellulosiruptor danielii]
MTLYKLIILSIAPSLFIALYIYFRDKFEKEPLHLLLKTFVWGILISSIVVPIEYFLMAYGSISASSRLSFIAFEAFIVAGLTEEYFKRLVVLRVAFDSPHFNQPFDGIVYCVFSAVGFAAIENVAYVYQAFQASYDAAVSVLVLRGVMAVPAHAMFGIVMGYYLGFAKFAPESRSYWYFKASLIIPMFFHGFYDFVLMLNVYGALAIVGAYEILLFAYCLRLIRKSQEISRLYF